MRFCFFSSSQKQQPLIPVVFIGAEITSPPLCACYPQLIPDGAVFGFSCVVLVCQACCTKVPQTEQLRHQQFSFLVLEVRSPRLICLQDWLLLRAIRKRSVLVSLACRWLSSCTLPSSYKDISYVAWGPTPGVSFQFNQHFKDPITKQSCISKCWNQVLTYEF